MAAFDEPTTVPKPVAGFDPARAAIGPLERLVLSSVDGLASVAEVAAASGLDAGDVCTVLGRLAELGALEPATPSPVTEPAPPPPDPTTAAPAAPSGGGWDRALLDEPGDLDLDVRNMVLDLFHALDEFDHYQLLGVARDADRKAIKSAYYGLAARLHTDRYFGKNLGSFKSKMEAVFGRITVAHDTLAAKQRRAEYDEYLKDRDRSRAYEKLLQWATVDSASPTPMPRAAATPAQPRILPPPPPSRAVPPAPPPSRAGGLLDRALQPSQASPRAPVAPVPPAAPAAPAAPPSEPKLVAPAGPVPLSPEQERARRLAAAQRLAGNRVSAARMVAANPSAPRIAAPTAEATRAATETLKVRYQDSVEAARRATIKRLVDGADEAISKEDFVTAANHLRVALTHADEAELRAKYESVNLKAREILADTYLKQAAYEESQEKWREAGATYAKAADARPGDPNIAAKAANAMRRDGRDLHAAARFGEVAVQKNPASAEFRVTLGLVYFDAGLLLRAKSELEQAVRLAPDDSKAKELLVRVKSAIG